MMVETGWNSSVTLHDDGRVSIIRADLRSGLFLHLDFTPREIEALQKVLVARGT